MNKTELVAALAEKTQLPKKNAELALNAVVEVITESLSKGDKVQIVGFGSFEVKDRPERIGFSRQVQSSPPLEFRLVCIRQGIDDLVDHHQEYDGRFLKGIAADHHIAKSHKDREAAGDETQPEIVTEGVLLPGIRDLERTDPEVRRHEHVLSEGRKGEGKHSARVLARELDNGNGKYHGSEGVEKASDHVPDDVLLLRYRGSVTDDESCKSVGHLWPVIHFRIPSLRRKVRIR